MSAVATILGVILASGAAVAAVFGLVRRHDRRAREAVADARIDGRREEVDHQARRGADVRAEIAEADAAINARLAAEKAKIEAKGQAERAKSPEALAADLLDRHGGGHA